MFVSFFPAPRAFFLSAAAWTFLAVLFWFFVARDAGHLIGLENPPDGTPPVIGVGVFLTKPFIWFYIYYVILVDSLQHSGRSSRHIHGSIGRCWARRSSCSRHIFKYRSVSPSMPGMVPFMT